MRGNFEGKKNFHVIFNDTLDFASVYAFIMLFIAYEFVVCPRKKRASTFEIVEN